MLNPSHWKALGLVAEHPGLSSKQLGILYGVQRTSMTNKCLPGLARHGLIRNACGTELRVKTAGNWYITPKGLEVLSHVRIIDGLLGVE